MKLSFILLLAGCLEASAHVNAQNITYSKQNASFEEAFKAIRAQTGYEFIYSSRMLGKAKKLNLKFDHTPVNKALDDILSDQGLTYMIIGKTIVVQEKKQSLYPAPPSQEQPPLMKVQGTVLDSASSKPLVGVTIQVQGSNTGTATDINGQFSLDVADNAVLVFSFLGYKKTEVQVNGRSLINVVLTPVATGLNQLVIVGYGTEKKVTVTGAISSISGDVLLKSPVANISDALVGRLPGILATQPSAEPGYDQSTIRVRGIGTFSGNADPLIMVDGIETQDMNNIDPDEVASITVLKDVSATAVYGVRGANGVILITTKRGQEGKPVFNFTSNVGVSKFINMRKYAGSYEWAQGWNQALMYDSYVTGSYVPQWTDAQLALFKSGTEPLLYPNTDWIALMFKPYSSQSKYNLNVSGGSDRVKYFVSAGIFNQSGLINPKVMSPDYSSQITYNRYNFRSNFDFQVSKRMKLKVDLAEQVEIRNSPNVGADAGNGTGQLIANTERVPPAMSPGFIDGKIVDEYAYFGGNPLERLLSGVSEQYNNTFTGTLRLDYLLDFFPVTRGLSVHGTISYNDFYNEIRIHGKNVVSYKATLLPDSTLTLIPQGIESPYGFSETNTGNNVTYAEFGLDYARSFGGHNVTALLYYNQQKRIDPALEYLVPHGYQGLVGRATYNYQERYLLEFDFGYNGTENFAPGKRFGFFPAYSAGWVMSNEPFFPRNPYISYLKFRGSYGVVGNDQIGGERFLYQPTPYVYGQNNNNYFFGTYGAAYNQVTGSSEGQIGNPDVTWERAKKVDVGVDLRFWKDKLSVSFDWFRENRDNILVQGNNIPALFGANIPSFDYLSPVSTDPGGSVNALLPAINAGRMRNGGVDGEIGFNNTAGKFNYWIKANYTYAHNKVLFSDEAPTLYPYQKMDGQRYGQLFGLIAEGYYNTWTEVNDANRPVSSWNNNRLQPGDIKYKDVNGDGKIDQNDEVPIGYSNFPEIAYGISLGGSYRGFDLTILFQGATHVSIAYSSRTIQGWQNDGGTLSQIIENSWTSERYQNGISSEYPRPSAMMSSNNAQESTWDIVNASYVRLKEAEIGYSLPEGRGSFLNRIGLRIARVYINCNNLVTWSHLLPGEDPENPPLGDLETYPLTLTVNAGITIQF